MHSVPDVLVRHVVDAFQAGLLRQHNVPNGITDIAQSIGNAEPQAVHWVGINLQRHIAARGCGLQPLVELDAVLHPSVVQALRRLIQDHLKDHIARGDLEKAGAPHLSQQSRGQKMAADLHLIPEPRSFWTDRARSAFEQNVFAPEFEMDDAMAIDHEAVITEYKEMKGFLQSSNTRQFAPKLNCTPSFLRHQ